MMITAPALSPCQKHEAMQVRLSFACKPYGAGAIKWSQHRRAPKESCIGTACHDQAPFQAQTEAPLHPENSPRFGQGRARVCQLLLPDQLLAVAEDVFGPGALGLQTNAKQARGCADEASGTAIVGVVLQPKSAH